jgi:DNA topoisomerase-1
MSAATARDGSMRSTTSGDRSARTSGRKPRRSPTGVRAIGATGPNRPIGQDRRTGARPASESVRLRYCTDAQAGISRRRAGRAFRYLAPDGRPVRDSSTLARIKSLAVPPAWTDVWICPDPAGHLQATGRDARGRKQYRYHPLFRRRRERAKFDRLVEFGRALPRIRRRVASDLAQSGLPRSKVLAALIRLLELTLIRVGNAEYARLNRSFGLTTLRDRHVRVTGPRMRFRFRGKSGSVVEVGLSDRRVARIVARCQELPGQELFQYVDDEGESRPIGSEDVNEYLREVAGCDVTAKTFRTWAATVIACRALRGLEQGDRQQMARRQVVAAIRQVAGRLGNTPAVVRQSYVHPVVLDAFLDGSLSGGPGGAFPAPAGFGLADQPIPSRRDELALLRILDRRAGGRSRS